MINSFSFNNIYYMLLLWFISICWSPNYSFIEPFFRRLHFDPEEFSLSQNRPFFRNFCKNLMLYSACTKKDPHYPCLRTLDLFTCPPIDMYKMSTANFSVYSPTSKNDWKNTLFASKWNFVFPKMIFWFTLMRKKYFFWSFLEWIFTPELVLHV